MGFSDIAWQLGNEPNDLQRQLGVNLSASQLGRDFYELKNLLKSFPVFHNSTLVGPDINQVGACAINDNAKNLSSACPALTYLYEVYNASYGALDAFTWHQYFLDGEIATKEDFLNSKNLEGIVLQFKGVEKFLKENALSQKDVWLGETASAYTGGTFGLSNRYASSLLWINKLGLAARYNYKVLIRQTLFHGCYAIIGEDLFPNPDYWASVLFKKLVSNRVLNVTTNQSPSYISLYGHCTSERSRLDGVILFSVNMANESFDFSLNGPFSKSEIFTFVLTPKGGDVTTRKILLNGEELSLTPYNDLPELKPVVSKFQSKVSVPGFGIAFWVFPNITLEICKKTEKSDQSYYNVSTNEIFDFKVSVT